ncbi:hypothetical protein SERLA73DRAFT_135769 [Serpula lacrymans var. lacrymans S7.3]|uniref:Uncharacterized protein n=1 Tax=Serpula lacrymans var. lacrymans (strain S7.3) TaxID=936435 RepID=F8PV17_SERL3|nr:hypothetical protein SERLA73DRAFT_135769 [Serpula lacrymans var. lacrymans S7.3]
MLRVIYPGSYSFIQYMNWFIDIISSNALRHRPQLRAPNLLHHSSSQHRGIF